MHKTYFNWSTGKDSALALHYLLQDANYSIDVLVTTINSHYNRVSMHGLHTALLQKQAKAIGIPLQTIELPEQPSMAIYEDIMRNALQRLKAEHYTHCVFGDIFLEDLKAYREQHLRKQNIEAIFPLWKKDTKTLINTFLDLGFKAVIVCANGNYFNDDFVGKTITKELISNLPEDVDPCGENGEFHTFCYDGPIFKQPVPFTIGEKIYREYDTPNSTNTKTGFWFCDLQV